MVAGHGQGPRHWTRRHWPEDMATLATVRGHWPSGTKDQGTSYQGIRAMHTHSSYPATSSSRTSPSDPDSLRSRKLERPLFLVLLGRLCCWAVPSLPSSTVSRSAGGSRVTRSGAHFLVFRAELPLSLRIRLLVPEGAYPVHCLHVAGCRRLHTTLSNSSCRFRWEHRTHILHRAASLTQYHHPLSPSSGVS